MRTEMIEMIVKIIMAVASVVITGYLIPLIKSKISNEKYKELLTFIEKCVEAAEKIYSPEEWQQKKVYVVSQVENKLDALGIDISYDEINALIEGFVKAVKG